MNITESELDSDFDHVMKIMTGYESLLNSFDTEVHDGSEWYFTTVMELYGLNGNESFWDTVKQTSLKVYEYIKDIIKKIKDWMFSGEGKEKAEQAETSAQDALKQLEELDPNIPIPENHPSTNPDKYFTMTVKYDSLPQTERDKVNTLVESMKTACSKVKGVKTTGELVSAWKSITTTSKSGYASISALVKELTDQADKAADQLKNPKIPLESEKEEVKKEMKDSHQAESKKAKESTKEAQIVAKIGNRFLAAELSLLGIVEQLNKLKTEKKEFKG